MSLRNLVMMRPRGRVSMERSTLCKPLPLVSETHLGVIRSLRETIKTFFIPQTWFLTTSLTSTFSTWGVTRWHGHHNLRPRWRGDLRTFFYFFREFRQMLLLAHSLPLIYLGCGSGPLSHWEDWGSGGSPEGKGESINGCFFRLLM